jgi:methyltransferase (TIGR00027 family)
VRTGWPSGTAIAVSAARAIASLDPRGPVPAIDPVARELVPAPIGVALGGLSWIGRRAPRVIGAMEALSLGLVEHLALRTLAIDRVVAASVAKGADQVVILGAGLDARAWRMDAMKRAVVFEVDHPATQRFKRERLGARVTGGRDARADVRFVEVDFERESLAARLAEAGHDTSRPTTWIWEGVTPYLAPEATRATLAIVAVRSAPRSVLAVTYATPSMANVPAGLRPLLTRLFARIGEPLRGLVSSETMRRWVEEAGMRVRRDMGVRDWAAETGRRPPRIRIAERLAVAEKAGG